MKHSFCTCILILSICKLSITQQPSKTILQIRSQIAILKKQIENLQKDTSQLKSAIRIQESLNLKAANDLQISSKINIDFYGDEVLRVQKEYTEDLISDSRLKFNSPQFDKKYSQERTLKYVNDRNKFWDLRKEAEDLYNSIYKKFVVPEIVKLNNLKESLIRKSDELFQLQIEKTKLWYTIYNEQRPGYIRVVKLSLPSAFSMNTFSLYQSELECEPIDILSTIDVFLKEIQKLEKRKEDLKLRMARAEDALKRTQLKWNQKNAEYIDAVDNDMRWASLLESLDAVISIVSAGEALPAVLLHELFWRTDLNSKPEFANFPSLPEALIVLRDDLSKMGPGSGENDYVKEQARQIRTRPLWGILPQTEADREYANIRAKELNGINKLKGLVAETGNNLSIDEFVEAIKVSTGMYFESKFNLSLLGRQTNKLKEIGIILEKGLMISPQTIGDKLLMSAGNTFKQKLLQSVKNRKIVGEFGLAFAVTAAKAGITYLTSERAEKFYQLAMIDLEWFVRRYELYETRVTLQLLEAYQEYKLRWLEEAFLHQNPSEIKINQKVISINNVSILGDDEINQEIILEVLFSKPINQIQYRVVSEGMGNKSSFINLDGIKGEKLVLPLPKKTFTVNDSGLFYLQFTSQNQQVSFDSDPTTISILKDDLEWNGLESGINTYPIKVIRARVNPDFKTVRPKTSFKVSTIAPLSDNKKGRGNIYLYIYSITDKKVLLQKQFVSSSGDGKPLFQELMAPELTGKYLLQLYNEDRQQVLATDTLQVDEKLKTAADPPGKFCNQRLTDFFNDAIKWGEFQYGFPRYGFEEGYESKMIKKILLLESIQQSKVLQSFLRLPYRKFFFETLKKIKDLPPAEKLKEYDKLHGTLGSNIIQSEISCDQQVRGSAIFYAGLGLGEIYARSSEYIDLRQPFSVETKVYMLTLLKDLRLTLESLRECLPGMNLSVLNIETIPDDPAVLLKLLREKLIVDFSSSNCCCESDLYKGYDNVILNGDAKKLNTGEMFPIVLTDNNWQSSSVFINKPILFTSTTNFSGSFSFEIDNPRGLGGGADGICFVLQSQSVNAEVSGEVGGGIGYGGINPSIAIEFDTYQNTVDLDDNHIGVDVDGNMKSIRVVPAPDKLDDNKPWYCWVHYNSTTSLLEMWVSRLTTRPSSPILQTTINLNTHFKDKPVYIGFTSGTGAGAGDHIILNWNFDF